MPPGSMWRHLGSRAFLFFTRHKLLNYSSFLLYIVYFCIFLSDSTQSLGPVLVTNDLELVLVNISIVFRTFCDDLCKVGGACSLGYGFSPPSYALIVLFTVALPV